jgi:predicted DNA-binding ribbon-helix-helix protein
MKEISGARGMTLSELVGEIDGNRQQGNLSSAIRLYVLDHFRSRAAQLQSMPLATAMTVPHPALPGGAARVGQSA